MEFKLRSPYPGPTHILKPNSNMLCHFSKSPFSPHIVEINLPLLSPHGDMVPPTKIHVLFFFPPCIIVISYVHMFLRIKDIRPMVSLHAGTLCLWRGGHGWVERECRGPLLLISFSLTAHCSMKYGISENVAHSVLVLFTVLVLLLGLTNHPSVRQVLIPYAVPAQWQFIWQALWV